MFHAVWVKFSSDDPFPWLPDNTFSTQLNPVINLQTNCACREVLVENRSSSIAQQPGSVYPRFFTMAATLVDDPSWLYDLF